MAELIAIDDGSSSEIWQELTRLIPTCAQLLRNERNLGLFGNWNHCLELADTRYFGILCSDDQLVDGYVEEAVALMDQHPHVSLVTTSGLLQSGQGQTLGQIAAFFRPGIYRGPEAIPVLMDFYARTGHNPFNYPSGVLVRTEAARAVGGFDANMRHAGDLDFFYRLLAAHDFAIMDRVGCRVTIHAQQAGAVLAQEPLGMRELVAIIERLPVNVLGSEVKKKLKHQHHALTLWHGLRFLLAGNRPSATAYARFARSGDTGLARLVWGLVDILLCKAQVKLFGRSMSWSRALARLKHY